MDWWDGCDNDIGQQDDMMDTSSTGKMGGGVWLDCSMLVEYTGMLETQDGQGGAMDCVVGLLPECGTLVGDAGKVETEDDQCRVLDYVPGVLPDCGVLGDEAVKRGTQTGQFGALESGPGVPDCSMLASRTHRLASVEQWIVGQDCCQTVVCW